MTTGSTSSLAEKGYYTRLVEHHKLPPEKAARMAEKYYDYSMHRRRVPSELADEHVANGLHKTV